MKKAEKPNEYLLLFEFLFFCCRLTVCLQLLWLDVLLTVASQRKTTYIMRWKLWYVYSRNMFRKLQISGLRFVVKLKFWFKKNAYSPFLTWAKLYKMSLNVPRRICFCINLSVIPPWKAIVRAHFLLRYFLLWAAIKITF